MRVDQHDCMEQSLPVVVGKAHGHHIGKALAAFSCQLIPIDTLQNTALVTSVSFYALSSFSVLVNRHVIEKQEIGFTKGTKSGTENSWPFIGFHTSCYFTIYMLLDCQCCFKF